MTYKLPGPLIPVWLQTLLFVAVVLLLMTAFALLPAFWSCASVADATGRHTLFRPFAGCFVRVVGQ
jgi:hypothetical protein